MRVHTRVRAGLLHSAIPLLLAVSFLTIVPIPTLPDMPERAFGRSVGYFSLVGVLLGAGIALFDAVLGRMLARVVVTALDLLAFALLTGGLHLDGLMDSCDGLFGGRDRERRLAIMRDSRVGSFGVLGGVLILLTEFAALATLTGTPRLAALVLAAALARWAMAAAVWVFPYARPDGGRGALFKVGLSWRQPLLATVWAVLALLLTDPRLLWLLPCAALVVLGAGRWIQGRLGGLTGDSYGAIGELVTVSTLVLLSGSQP